MMTAKSQQFLNELALFYRNKGQHGITSHHFIVRINGKPVNLCDLYSSVLEMGGSYKVNQYNRWDEIYTKLFKSQPLGANVSVALRQIYQRYLIPYEKVNFSNFISDSADNDDEDSLSNKDSNSSFIIHSSLSNSNSNSSFHNQSSQNLYNKNNLSKSINPLNKLFCSLTSDLPNEMDFGLRVATILTNSKEIDNLADFKFIDNIIECCILYTCSCERTAYSFCSDFKFEDEEIIKKEIEKLIDLNIKENKNNFNVNNRSDKFNSRKFVPFKSCNCFIKFWTQTCKSRYILKIVFEINDEELDNFFLEDYCFQEHQKNYYKIKRIAELLKNVSYSIEKLRSDQMFDNEDNIKLTNNPISDNASENLLRFFLLLLYSEDQSLINIALDVISNISPLATCSYNQDSYINLLKHIYDWCIQKVLNSYDVNCLNRCLEIISKLVNYSHEVLNRIIIFETLKQKAFFNRLTELLTCQHDVGIVISTLDCCLSLSQYYPKLLLTDNKHLIKILINLVNCEESQYFSSNSIQKIKIVDERNTSLTDYNQQQSNLSNNLNNSSGVTTVYVHNSLSNQQQQQQQQQQKNEMTNPAVLADNEAHVMNWFFSKFEAKLLNCNNKLTLKVSDMYSDYVKHSCVSGRKNVVTGPVFSQLLKKYFPTCVFLNSNEVNGITVKNSPNNVISPILKAHLSTPPKSSSSNSYTNTINTNTNSSANNGSVTAPTSSLIKNLLANKLRNNQANLDGKLNEDFSKIVPVSINTPNLNTNFTLSFAAAANNESGKQTCFIQQQPTNLITITSSTNPNFTTTLSNGTLNTVQSSNLITVPLQTQFSQNTNSGNMIINTNNSSNSNNTGQQILLVRTILPQQNLITTPNQNVPMRLILPASVLNSQGQLTTSTFTVNGTTCNVVNTTPTSVANCVQTLFQTSSNEDNKKTFNNSISNNNHLNSNSQPSSTSHDILLKAVLGSGIPPSENSSNQIRSTSSVKSSPLLNVLLDKGKLPDYSITTSTNSSTIANNTTENNTVTNSVLNNSANTLSQSQQSLHINSQQKQITLSSTLHQLSNITNTVTTSQTTSVNNVSPTKMYILTTSKSPIGLKNCTGIQSSNQAQPLQSFVFQQQSSNTNTTSGQPAQIILQSNPSNLIATSQNTTFLLTSPQQNTLSNISQTQNQIINSKLISTNQTIIKDVTSMSSKQTITTNNSTNSKTNSKELNFSNSVNNNDHKNENHADKNDSSVLNVNQNLVLKLNNNNETIKNSNEKIDNLNNVTPKNIIKSPLETSNYVSNQEKSVLNEENLKSDISNSNTVTVLAIKQEDANIETNNSSTLNNTIKNFDVVSNVTNRNTVGNSNSNLLHSDKNTDQSVNNFSILTNGNNLSKDLSQLDNNESIENQLNENSKVMTLNLKRNLDNEDQDLCKKKSKLNSTVTITPVQTTKQFKSEKKLSSIISTSSIESSNTNSISNVNSKSNSTITSLNDSPKSTSTCTIEKITIKKPNQNELSNNNNQVINNENVPHNIQITLVKNKLEFTCEWANCKKTFSLASNVFLHVHKDHIISSDLKQMTCLWGGQEGTGPGCQSLRPKYSLLTHLQDFHCNIQNLQQSALRSQQLNVKGSTDILPPIVPPAHPGYANNAAYMAIRRHAVNFVEPKPCSNVGLLSTSVRITSAMILRNLAQHSTLIKKLLKNYESFLSELCIFDGREDSRTLAQCLAIITDDN